MCFYYALSFKPYLSSFYTAPDVKFQGDICYSNMTTALNSTSVESCARIEQRLNT